MRKKLEARWKIKFQEVDQPDTYLLSANIKRHSSTHTSVGLKTYIEKNVKDHLPMALSDYPKAWARNPCDKNLMKDYEEALKREDENLLNGEEAERYGTLVGVLQFACSFRPDVSFPVGVGGRCRTFPTAAMMKHMERVLVYLGHTSDLSIHYSARHPDAYKLTGRSDSSWEVRRSTTGFVIRLAGGAIEHGSRRQHCIAMSSTEAEMMGLAELALELLYVRDVLTHLGHHFEPDDTELATKDPEAHRLIHAAGDIVHGPTEVGVDNKGAYDLCHRCSNGKNSRHVERKVYKMRELRTDGVVKLILVPTEDMTADLLTKPLSDAVFKKHRDEIMNLAVAPG